MDEAAGSSRVGLRGKLLAVAMIAGAMGAACFTVVRHLEAKAVWDHFDVVRPGVLYRSGRLTTDQLTKAVETLKLKTVVSFLRDAREVDVERDAVKRLGASFVQLPMPGDGFGQQEQFEQVLELTRDPKFHPALVHCARGTCRTGAAVAYYRFETNGWTIEDVAAEMRRQTYRQGWLPGYIYAMVHQRPFDELYHPRIKLN